MIIREQIAKKEDLLRIKK